MRAPRSTCAPTASLPPLDIVSDFGNHFPMEEPVFTSSLSYQDPKAALAWLERAFGFEITMAIDGPPEAPEMGHYEMSCAGQGRVVIGAEWAEWTRSPAHTGGGNTQSVHVKLPGGLDEHCERARAAGAVIAADPEDQFYGDRIYRAFDYEGHCWTFAVHVRDVTRAEAEAAIGQPIMATSWQ
jgi:uncharacterized glyoxalase superfamily protein PhnB